MKSKKEAQKFYKEGCLFLLVINIIFVVVLYQDPINFLAIMIIGIFLITVMLIAIFAMLSRIAYLIKTNKTVRRRR